jgi:WD40 repeat protein
MRGTEAPIAVDEVVRSACLGAGTFRFSPDGSQFGFIDYEAGAAGSSFADGFLKIHDAATGEMLYQTESVTAFDIGGGVTAFVNFFTNDQGEADEVAVQIWNGENDREVATLRPDDTEETGQCRFVSASVNVLPNGQLSLVLGQRCDQTGTTTWQLYTVNPAERTATRAASEPVTGGYQAFARTNTQFVSPDGNGFLFTVPDGITANTAGLYLTPLDSLTPQVVVERQIVMPAVTTPANATPDVSPDGRWLAMVQTSPNNENTLLIYDLSDLTLSPISYSAGSPGDVISAMQFTPDGSRLIAVVGGDDQANNSIVAFNLADGSDFRVERGRFNSYLALSQDGAQLAIGDWQVLEDPNEPPYLNLVSIDINESASTTLFEGAVVQDGEVVEQSFAVPLAYR